MKSIRALVLFSLFCALSHVSGPASAQGSGLTLLDIIAPRTVVANQTFDIDVVVRNVTDLYAYNFDLTYTTNASPASTLGAVEGNFLQNGGNTYFLSGTPDVGAIRNVADTLTDLVPGVSTAPNTPGLLASFQFRATDTGPMTFSVDNITLSDSQLQPIAAQGGSATVNAIPELTTSATMGLLLLCSGLLFARRRARSGRRFLLFALAGLSALTQGLAPAQAQDFLPIRPLIVVPGIGGSWLVWSKDPKNKDEIPGLPPVGFAYYPLSLTSLGSVSNVEFTAAGTPRAGVSSELYALGIYRGGTIPTILGNITVPDFGYDALIKTLANNGQRYVERRAYAVVPPNGLPENTLYEAPYDFRFSIADTAKTVAAEIKVALNETRAGSVDIVAHSMGGLVVKEMLADGLLSAEKVHLVITVATPHFGAAQALKGIRYGDNFGSDQVSSSKLQTFAHNIPGDYDLLPSRTYFGRSTGYLFNRANFDKTKSDGPLLDFTQTSAVLGTKLDTPLSAFNKMLLTDSDNRHKALDAWANPNGVLIYTVVGYNNMTQGKYVEANVARKEDRNGKVTALTQLVKWPLITWEGDGTAPLRGAELPGYGTTFYLNDGAFNVDHTSQLGLAELDTFILNILAGNKPMETANIKQAVGQGPQQQRPPLAIGRTATAFSLLTTTNTIDSVSIKMTVTNEGGKPIPGTYTYSVDQLTVIVVPATNASKAQVLITASNTGFLGNKIGFDLWQTDLEATGRPLRTLTWEQIPVTYNNQYQLLTNYGAAKGSVLLMGNGKQGQGKITQYAPTNLYAGGGAPLLLADLNGDGTVDNLDLQYIKDLFGKTAAQANLTSKYRQADTNDDGIVNLFDLVWVGQAKKP